MFHKYLEILGKLTLGVFTSISGLGRIIGASSSSPFLFCPLRSRRPSNKLIDMSYTYEYVVKGNRLFQGLSCEQPRTFIGYYR